MWGAHSETLRANIRIQPCTSYATCQTYTTLSHTNETQTLTPNDYSNRALAHRAIRTLKPLLYRRASHHPNVWHTQQSLDSQANQQLIQFRLEAMQNAKQKHKHPATTKTLLSHTVSGQIWDVGVTLAARHVYMYICSVLSIFASKWQRPRHTTHVANSRTRNLFECGCVFNIIYDVYEYEWPHQITGHSGAVCSPLHSRLFWHTD